MPSSGTLFRTYFTVRDVVSSATMPQQQYQSQMPSQAYNIFAMGPPRVKFLFQRWAFTDLFMLMPVAVFTFCFQVATWLACSQMGAQP